jgi:hypothetical protein
MKQKVFIAFRHTPPKFFLSSFLASFIKKWTKSNYYHCEVFFQQKRLICNNDYGVKLDKSGFKFGEDWDVYYIESNISKKEAKSFESFCFDEEGSRYDWKGILFTQILDKGLESKDKWFCSEISAAALKVLGIKLTKENSHYSPGELLREISDFKTFKKLP